MAVILYKIWALVLWNTIVWVKAMHLFLNILTFFLIYKTAILFYNDKKVANQSVLLYTISFYAYAWNTMWIDQDLAINPLLFLLTLYLYKRYSDFSLKGILLTVLSCSLLTISRPILWVIVMWIIFIDMMLDYIIDTGKKIKFSWIVQSVLKYLKLFVPYLIVWWLLCYLIYRLFPSPVVKALNTYMNLFLWNSWSEWVSIMTRVSFLWQVFLYTSPLILSIVFLFKNFKKNQIVIISSVTMILYMCLWTSWWDPTRWMMPVLPIFVIGWWYLCSEFINKKNRYRIILPFVLLLCFNYFFLDYSSLPLNISDYLSDPLNKVFILTTTIFYPIYLDSKLIFLITWFSLLTLLLAIILKNKIYKFIFLIFSLWVNLFLVVTGLFHVKQPNIGSIWKQMYEFCAENCKLDQKIYTDQVSKDTIMLWLWDKNIWSFFDLTPATNVVEIVNNLLNNPINLTWTNLFTQNLEKWDIINIIKHNWTWFAFLTHYFGNINGFDVLYEKCEIVKKIDWRYDNIYGIIYLCNIN